MKLTILRFLVLITTLLVIAAGTCLATFAATPGPSPMPVATAASLAPDCVASSLALAETGTIRRADDAIMTFDVTDVGAACRLARFAVVTAFDAAGRDVPIARPMLRGRELFVILRLAMRPGARAQFTIATPLAGNPCVRVARLRFAVGAGAIEAPTTFTLCTAPNGVDSDVSLVNFAPAPLSAPEGVRTSPAGAASTPASRL